MRTTQHIAMRAAKWKKRNIIMRKMQLIKVYSDVPTRSVFVCV